jgi:membrane-associated protease RseP (regulator of RpoE activity)
MSKENRTIIIQILLFVATFITTTLAGAEWTYGRTVFYGGLTWNDFFDGMHFSVPFLLILTVHEFGHYFTALHHKVKTSLPYYIPIPPIPLPFSIGTMGAVIRLRSKVYSKKQNFDIGIAGPLAGFVMALIVLVYGFTTLPPAEHIYKIHPQYQALGLNYADQAYQPKKGLVDVTIGKNLIFLFFEQTLADPSRMPNPHEIMHYPYLLAGFLALVFTFLNLMPIGQLDGGHILYGLLGFKKHKMVASVFFVAFIFYAGLGFEFISLTKPASTLIWTIPAYLLLLFSCFRGLRLQQRDTVMYVLLVFAAQITLATLNPTIQGYPGWLLFGFVIGRFLGVEHPPTEIEEPLNDNRKILGWLAIVIFILCFTPSPIMFKEW